MDDQKQQEAYMIMKEMYNNKKSRTKSTIFGEFVASKIESLETDHAKNTVEHLISNVLWEASLGKYDQPSQPDNYIYSPHSLQPSPSPSSLSLASYISSPSHVNPSYYHLTTESSLSREHHVEDIQTSDDISTANEEETSNIILNAFQNSSV